MYLIGGLQESSLDNGVLGLKQIHDCSARSHAVPFYQAYNRPGHMAQRMKAHKVYDWNEDCSNNHKYGFRRS
jgi:hypothetical protein